MYHLALIPDAIYCASKLPNESEVSDEPANDTSGVNGNAKESPPNGVVPEIKLNGIHKEEKLDSISEEPEELAEAGPTDNKPQESEPTQETVTKEEEKVEVTTEKAYPSPLVANLVALWNKVASDLSAITLSPAEILEGARYLLTLPPATIALVSDASKDGILIQLHTFLLFLLFIFDVSYIPNSMLKAKSQPLQQAENSILDIHLQS